MAAYPSFAQIEGSAEEWLDDRALDTAVNGTVKARAFFTARKRAFSLRHRLGATDRGTLSTFYDNNRLITFTLTWAGDSQTYTVIFDGVPRYEYVGGGDAWVTVRVREQ